LIDITSRRLTIRDQNDLPIGSSVVTPEQLPGEPESLFDISSVLHEVGNGDDRGQVFGPYHLRIGAERDEVQRILRELRFD